MGSARDERLWLHVLFAAALTSAVTSSEVSAKENKLRSDLEKELPTTAVAYHEAPGDHARRRAYADLLFQLGNMWPANDVIAPMATVASANTHDLALAARLALMLGDYDRAERLFQRLSEVADKHSTDHGKAISGLVLTYYQTNQYAKAKNLKLPELGSQSRRLGTLLTFMQKFEGAPYQIEWANADKVARLKMINDIRAPAALPLMNLEINGQPVQFILDTGGDQLYIDRDVAQKLGIKTIHQRQAAYVYTKGKTVNEPLGVAESVKLGEVTLKNVPVVVATWKSFGVPGDGVVTTQVLKQFLSTIDYERAEITLRERSEPGHKQMLESFAGKKAHRMPFFLSGTHMMFTHGSLNGRKGLDLFMDSGLAMTVPLIVHEETAKDLGLKRDPAAGAQRVIYPIDSHGVGELTRGKTRALGNVRLGADPYWSSGFIFDALISHQYLYHLRSWTIDFDTMTYYFPSDIKEDVPSQANAKKPTETKKEVVAKDSPNPLKRFVGPYKCEAIKTEVEFTLTGDQLSFTASGNLRGRFTLKKLAENTYEAEDTPQKVTVVFKLRDAKVTEAELTVSGQGPFVFKRG